MRALAALLDDAADDPAITRVEATRWLSAHDFGRPDHPVVVSAAGERWPGGELRPALEDLLGAGAVIAGLLPDLGRSPEAAAAEAPGAPNATT